MQAVPGDRGVILADLGAEVSATIAIFLECDADCAGPEPSTGQVVVTTYPFVF